ncbi:hypothetical protein [Psychrobacter phenylpyruvicus]|uniref:Uncharacterized protein n=1 Tax=Psychrobacter phenylpyruvicus TaxID=29432 RepID=A0A379LK44_9GAMM|nr:hypothetical protein [Psychrobacter phenylpyruvicus]SUD90801.1 Uncharacterised protein [Psychrobacter phenylpyruvicus]
MQVNTNLSVDSLNGRADTTTINGGVIDISGASEGGYSTDKLYIETVQNTRESSNKSSGANIGISLSGGAPTGGSLGANKANGNAKSIIAAEQSGIIDRGDKQFITVGHTTNIGGIMANIQTDSEGNQSSSTLNFTTDTLTTKDIINTATNDQRNLGGSIGIGTGKQGQSINNLGVQVGNNANEFESVIKATIGQGAIVTTDTSTGQNSLAGANRDPFNTEIIIKDQQTAGLGVDANIDARVFTEAGRTQIADEQKNIGKNAKKVGTITIADALKVPAIIAAVTDKGNKNPDSQNKYNLGKVKDSITLINNINHTGMSDDTAELNAKIEKIEEEGLTNEIVKQVELNQLKDKFAKGTDAEDATVYINPDLTKSRGGVVGTVVLGSANETTGKDIYLDSGALNTSDGVTIANGNIAPIGDTYNNANTLTEEITHSNGQGEASASKMGNLGEIVYNVGKWANNGDIADAKGNIDTTAINNTNTALEQQEMLAANKKRLETQQADGDAFEDENIILHGGGLGDPSGVANLANTMYQLTNGQMEAVNSPDVNNSEFYNSSPVVGAVMAEHLQHTPNRLKVIADFSMGGDAALLAGTPRGVGKWDYRVVAGARVDYDNKDFVEQLNLASHNSKRVIVIAIRGDKDLGNDGALRVAGKAFGDRSYEGAIQAIRNDYDTMENYYKFHPNVVIVPSTGPHGGGGNAPQLQEAIEIGKKY